MGNSFLGRTVLCVLHLDWITLAIVKAKKRPQTVRGDENSRESPGALGMSIFKIFPEMDTNITALIFPIAYRHLVYSF